MARKRKAYRRKDGRFVRGTVVKPKFFKKKLAVDLDFHSQVIQGPKGKLKGRHGRKFLKKRIGERVPVIRTLENGGLIAGRAKKMTSPYPKQYTVFSKIGKKMKQRKIPVTEW